MPLSRNAFQLPRTAVVELELRARDQIPDRPRNEDLSPARRCGYTRADVNGEARYLSVGDFALASVEARTKLEPVFSGSGEDGPRALDRPRGTVERREETVAGRVDLLAAETGELSPDGSTVLREQLAPAAISQPGSLLGRADDVGEEHSGEHPIGHMRRLRRAEKALDLDNDLGARVGGDVEAGNGYELCVRQAARERL